MSSFGSQKKTPKVSLRGAVSIARRLLDPLSELVKIDPRSIGVGLYQHDVDQKRLAEDGGGVWEVGESGRIKISYDKLRGLVKIMVFCFQFGGN